LSLPVLALPIQDFKAGVYFISVETQYGQVQREFVIE
jgi:hypothetical protein